MEEDIVGLHVTMHNVILIEHLEGLEELFENEHGLLFWEFDLFGKEVFKCTTIAVFVNEIKVIGCFKHVVVPDDVRVLFDVS